MAYQEGIIEKTASWRPLNRSSSGQDLCTLFFFFFRDARVNGTDFGDRILVSIDIPQRQPHCNVRAGIAMRGDNT